MNGWPRMPFDWEEIQRNLLKQIPIVQNELGGKGIEAFVQNAVKKALSQDMAQNAFLSGYADIGFNRELFETQRSVFVLCRFPGDALPKDVKLFAGRTKLKIEDANRSEIVALPSDIVPSRTIARFKKGVLEVRMPKSTEPDSFREIFIRE